MPVISQPTTALASRSVLFTAPFGQGGFRLDTSAIAGIFGGQTVVSAMATLPFHKGARWVGLYNSPGSYETAKIFGKLSRSTFFDGLFPSDHTNPATLFGLDGRVGPKFRAAHSGTVIDETGHMAALLMKKCSALNSVAVEGRETSPVNVTIAELHHIPDDKYRVQFSTLAPWFAFFPIVVSVGACVGCFLVKDWYSASMVLLGIVASAISCFVVGSGTVFFTHPQTARGSPRGDGILVSDNEIVVLRGAEGAVNSITRGRFSLQFDSEPHYEKIGWCSFLLMFQFIAQLLLIPQGTLFGQIMFITSLAFSWGYNLWLSAFDQDEIQRNILMKNVLRQPQLTKYGLPNRTSMAVFVLLILKATEVEKVMDYLLPNDTNAWRKWKDVVVSRIITQKDFDFVQGDWDNDNFTKDDRDLLKALFEDARDGYEGFKKCPPASH
ncbi:hypothetical protein EDC04DRAFT_884950 [Pisolithus marmoratus]|nr:hypothetical protein EDC04DRAFT_884950 [Pisolithus marmoratus]